MLWVRSQDKQVLMKVNDFTIVNISNIKYAINGSYKSFEYYLGTYSSKERAIEVLDDIQNCIFIKCSIKNADYQETDLIMKSLIVSNMIRIYQMPEK